jgi:sialic acid synthase SpsE
MVLCDELFGHAHHRSNKENAFRHALWNILICHNTLKKSINEEKSMVWTRKVTDLYEKVTDNDEMEKAMDLHNNNVGLNLFSSVFNKKEAEIINILQNMMVKSEKVTNFDDFIKFKHKLVYLE